MKKILLGLIIGIVISVPISVFAHSDVIGLPWTKAIYKVSRDNGEVTVFDDADNKCYLVREAVYGGTHTSISCVKR